MKIDLVSMKISAFRDFGEDQSVDFPQNQICAIMGENLDDDGSNGSGKTSLSLSIPINIYGPKVVDVPVDDLNNKYLRKRARLVGHYKINGKDLVIDRVLGGKLQFQYDSSEWIDGKVDDVQKKINDIFGISAQQLLMLTNKSQENSEHFLIMKDSEKKDFLGEFFNVEQYDAAKLLIDLDMKQADKTTSELFNRFTSIDAKFAIFNEGIENKRREIEELNKISVDEFKTKVLECKTELDTLKKWLSTKSYLDLSDDYTKKLTHYNEISEKNIIEVRNIDLSIESIDKEIARLKSVYESETVVPQDLLDEKTKVENAIRILEKRVLINTTNSWELNNITKEIVMLESSVNFSTICDKCGQPYKDNAHKEKLANEIELKKSKVAALSNLVETLELDKAILQKSKEDRDAILARISESSKTNNKEAIKIQLGMVLNSKNPLTKLRESLLSAISQAKDSVVSLERDLENRIKSEINSKSASVTMLEMKISTHENELKRLQEDIDKLQNSIKRVEQEKQELTVDYEKALNEKKILDACSDVLSRQGFLGYIFDNILEELNNEINKNIQYVPNIRQYSFQFSPDKYVKSTGALNKTITYSIRKGSQEVNFKTLSGGEKLGLIFAVDEALEEIVSRRLGVHLGWKVLDEQFTWIDQNSKEPILEFYKAKSVGKTYMIIEHSSEFNAAMDSRIIITKKNGIATIGKQ